MTTSNNQPSHLVYHVADSDGNAPKHWTQIGAMWPHKDGKGWNVQLQFLPVGSTGKLTIRQYELKPKNQAA